MKVCTYCNAQNDDNAHNCSKCSAADFKYICNNCKTVFTSGFCPSCGTRAGEVAKTCPSCGVKTFSPFCPSCGSSMNKNAGTRDIPAASAPTYIVVNQQPTQRVQVAAPKKKSNAGMVWLTIFFPFITAWIILFSSKYEKGMRIFALIYSAVMGVSMLASGSEPVAALIIFAPIIGYGIKLIFGKKSASEKGQEKDLTSQNI